jgi:hypothetical protein
MHGRLMVDPREAREHCERLLAQGISQNGIAVTAGVSEQSIHGILTGHPGRRIRLRTAEAVLAVPLDAVPPEGYVPKAAALRLTRAMQASGITLRQQSKMLGYRASSECLPFLYQSGLTIEARTHKRVETLYRLLARQGLVPADLLEDI